MSKAFHTHKDDRTNLLIIDSLNLAFRYKHQGGSFASKMLETINSLARSYNAKRVIVLGDGGSVFRKGIHPEYKANRKAKQEAMSEDEKTAWQDFIDEYEKAMQLVQINYPYLRFKGIEADDIAAYIVKHYKHLFEHVWNISTDRDWHLLLGDNVSQFSYIKREEKTFRDWDELYSVEDYITIKVLAGDSGDNVPGVTGVGPKRALNLLREYGSALDIYDAIPLPGNQKFIQALNEFKEQILVNYKLMDLLTFCDDIIGDNAKEIELILGE